MTKGVSNNKFVKAKLLPPICQYFVSIEMVQLKHQFEIRNLDVSLKKEQGMKCRGKRSVEIVNARISLFRG